MPKGSDRWLRRDLRHRFPLTAERQHSPRFDGLYVATDDKPALRFHRDGTMDWEDQAGVWKVEDGELLVTTETQQCSGAIDQESIFLLCAAVAGGRESRSELELRFRQTD
jgi:hypothetical protein